MNVTNIEWTATTHADGTTTPGFSANPLKYRDKRTGQVVWGCVKKSPGCAHCYAEQLAKRYGRGGPFTREQMAHLEPFLDEAELRKMLTAKTVGGVAVSGGRCFVGDMTDVFGDWVPDAMLDRLFAVMKARPDVTFQLLTKRADRMAVYTDPNTRGTHLKVSLASIESKELAEATTRAAMLAASKTDDPEHYRASGEFACVWPLPNVWLGVSAENQAAADERIPHLLRTPAAVRFISAEPLLGPVNLSVLAADGDGPGRGTLYWIGHGAGLDWIICGGESGPDSRHCRTEWVGSVVEQCKAAKVPVFVKQLGANVTTRLPDGERWAGGDGLTGHLEFSGDGFGNYHVRGLRDKKGGDIAEWPHDLRVREFPAPAEQPAAPPADAGK